MKRTRRQVAAARPLKQRAIMTPSLYRDGLVSSGVDSGLLGLAFDRWGVVGTEPDVGGGRRRDDSPPFQGPGSTQRKPTRRKPNGHAGFTLLEILVAVGLLAVLGVILATSTASLIGAIRDNRQSQEYYHAARVALGRMESEIAMAYLSKHQNEHKSTKTVFVGKQNSLVFATIGHRRMVREARESDEAVIEYKLEKDSKSGESMLVRREKALIDDQPYKGGRKQVLAWGVKKLTFSYWDMDKESWQSDWKVEIDNAKEEEMKKAQAAAGVTAVTGNAALGSALAANAANQEQTHGPQDLWLPARVKVTMVLATEQGELTFETQTRIRLQQPLSLGGIHVPKPYENSLNPYAAMPGQTPGNFSVPGAAGGMGPMGGMGMPRPMGAGLPGGGR